MRAIAEVPDVSTVGELLVWRAARTPQASAYFVQGSQGSWQPITWSQHHESALRLSGWLHEFGVRHGDRVGIVAATSAEWEVAQMATLMCGAIAVGIDPHYPREQLIAILRDVRPTTLFMGNADQVGGIPPDVGGRLERRIVMHDDAVGSGQEVVALRTLLAAPPAVRVNDEHRRRPSTKDEAIMVFSSGTTGLPKPIIYRHDQVLIAMRAMLNAFPDIAEGSRLACWLPLANLFQRMLNFCAVARGAASYVISDPREVMTYIGTVRPDLLIGVPRFYEKVHEGIRDRLARMPGPVSAIARWAISTGRVRARTGREGQSPGTLEKLRRAVADRLVLRRLRGVFGGNLRYLVSGSAPMPEWLLEYFESLGLPVFEAYGVSENIVPVAMNRPGQRKLGTVGKPLPPNDVKLGADGEILVRGPGVFEGYWSEEGAPVGARPDGEGYWPTGDLGLLDEDGYLRVVGRKSDMFKTSGGRWIVPSQIEARLRRIPYVEQAVVVGTGKKTIVALLSLRRPPAKTSASGTSDSPEVHSWLGEEQECQLRADVAAEVSDLAEHQRPAGFLIVRGAFTIDGGELTTNLKLRRKAVEAKYAAELEATFGAVEGAAAPIAGARSRAVGTPVIHYA